MPSISFMYLLVILTCTGSSLSHDEECLALLEFKERGFYQDHASFNATRIQKLDSWRKITSMNASDKGGSDCCTWGGVVCSIEGHVIGLDLSQSSLHGFIKSNSTLFNLVHLEMLDLSMNDFVESQIPSEIGRLQQLRILDLSNTGFGGQIPKEISHLTQLSSLDLSRNPLKLQSPNLEYLLQNLTRLEKLNLFGVDVSSSLPRFLANFSSLRSINLGNCQLQGEFPSEMFHLPKLKFLRLRNNTSLTGSLPEFHNNTSIEHLNLFSTGFAGIIPESISNLKHLVYLALGNCNFSGHIPGSLSNLTELTRLSLESNKLIGPVPSLESLSKLIHLNLSDNNLSGRLDLDMFIGFNKLKILDLGHNNLSCVATNNYTEGSLPVLKLLQLASCNLNEFPAFLRFQKKIDFIFLSHNKIKGLVPEWIWNNNQDTLKMIDLSYNFITGFHQHPDSFPWTHLQSIQISYNQLQGELLIPPLTTVIYDVSNNNFTGEIPPSICERKSLQFLDLSSNNMIGTLPPCLGNLSSSLSVLVLKQNKFHGPMMNTFMYDSPLKRIDLSENRLTGQLSKSLANCTNLEVLALGDNSFNDVFPFWLGNLANLQVLILRSNKFYGDIQGLSANSSEFQKLRIVDLSNNNFGGQLPNRSFQIWNAMKSVSGKSTAMQFEISLASLKPYQYLYSMTLTIKGVKTEYERILNIFTAIDLSSNNFEGEIPQSLQDLQGLESLNLSKNHLTGRILPSLGNLKNLEALDLSRNEISGEIPQQLLQLSFLEIFNVSFNHLEGRIPLGKQFNTFDSSSYKGNLGLCGQPLSKDCQSSKTSTTPPTSNQYESLLPSEGIDWMFIFSGVGSGMVIGIVFGNILYAKYKDWFIERSKKKKKKGALLVIGPLTSMSTN